MASNSDSIYYVLTKLKNHPELITARRARYTNTIIIQFTDSLKIADSGFYFPDMRLMVNRLSNDFVAKHGDLLDYYFQQTLGKAKSYLDAWVTTSHLPDKHLYMLELSFE